MTHRRLRLLSGLVMFAYITSHLLNHGLGVVSLALAESGLRLEMAFWRTPIMTILLYGAVAMHFALALWTLYSRRDWRLPGVEVLRLAAGFSFPLLLHQPCREHAARRRTVWDNAIIHADHHESACGRQAGHATRAFGSRLASRMPRDLDYTATVPCHAKNKASTCCAGRSYPSVGRCRIRANGVGSLGYWTATSDELQCFASQNGTRELGCQSGEDLSWCRFLSLFTWSPAHVLAQTFPSWSG